MPLEVLVEEALQAARFLERRWTTQRGRRGEVRTPGLDLVAGAGLISERTRHELVELVAALREASGRARLARPHASDGPSVAAARALVAELRGVLQYAGLGRPELQAQCRAVAREYSRARSHDALALALDTWAALAQQSLSDISGLGAFNPKTIDEARALAHELRSKIRRVDPAYELESALAERNRIAAELVTRISAVRAAARFVFRRKPQIVREVTSAYERRTRLARLRRGATQPPR